MEKTEQKNVPNHIPDPLFEPVRGNSIADEQNKTRLITPNREGWTCNPQTENR